MGNSSSGNKRPVQQNPSSSVLLQRLREESAAQDSFRRTAATGARVTNENARITTSTWSPPARSPQTRPAAQPTNRFPSQGSFIVDRPTRDVSQPDFFTRQSSPAVSQPTARPPQTRLAAQPLFPAQGSFISPPRPPPPLLSINEPLITNITSNNDCRLYFFNNGNCRFGTRCKFRHCEEALRSNSTCPEWTTKTCTQWSACPLRHMSQREINNGNQTRTTQKQNPSSSNTSRTEANNKNNDCKYYFKQGFCRHSEERCKFRHNEQALRTIMVCPQWKTKTCTRFSNCPMRHMNEENINNLNAQKHSQGKIHRKTHQNPENSNVQAQAHNSQTQQSSKEETKKEEIKELECCICLSTYSEIKSNNNKLATIDCGHILCLECSTKIILSEKICPLCRGPIRQQPRILFA